jgi:hypothetical protein
VGASGFDAGGVIATHDYKRKEHTMAGIPKNAIAVSEDALDPEQFIGRLAMSTLPDREVKGSKLLRSWATHGLDVGALPEARQPVHIFQTACSSVKQKRASNGQGNRMQITADEVADNGTCDYQIGVKVWDVANKVIEYRRDMLVTFDKRTSQITTDSDDADPRLRAIEQQIRDHFDANARTVPGQKVRNAVRATLLSLGAQNVRRKAGGVYFVPTTYKRTRNGKVETHPTKPILDGLHNVLADLYGDDADFHIIPLANAEGEREMVRRHFVINAKERAEELSMRAVKRLREGSGKRGVRSDLMANLWNERRALLMAVEQFEQLVNVEQKDLAANLRDLDESLMKLQEFADKEAADKP